MKRILLLTTLIAFVYMVTAQTTFPKVKNSDARKLQTTNLVESGIQSSSGTHVPYRGGNTVALGTAGNLFTILNGESNMIDYDPALNSLIFIHRTDPTIHLPDNVGQYRYDLSTDGGLSWTIDHGILNPSGDANMLNGRFPQATFYNPIGNTDPNNAYIVYSGTYHTGSPNGAWVGTFTGVEKLDGTGQTETINDTRAMPIGGNTIIGGALVPGKPGTFWTINKHTRLTFTSNVDSVTGLLIGEGTFTGADVSWTYDTIGLDLNYSYDNAGHLLAPLIAFDPTGRYGWIACGADLNTNPVTGGVYTPVFWSSTDSGATWSSAIQVDPRAFTSITDLYSDSINLGGAVGIKETDPCMIYAGSDLIVDANGNPHFMTPIGYSLWANPPTNGPYWISAGFINMFDFTYDGTNWDAMYIDSLSNYDGPMVGALREANRPNISRTPDGNKLFFCWLDTDPPLTENNFPDCRVKMYDIVAQTWTETVNTTLNSAFESQAFYASVSPTAIVVAPGQYIIPTVITEIGATELSSTKFHYYESQIGSVLAGFTYDYKGFGGRVIFTDSSLFTPLTWSWDFGDGTATSSVVSPSHQYTADGMYNVCLTVTNSFGTDQICKLVDVGLVGVEDVALEELISIRPNPSNGKFIVYLDGYNATDADIKFYNVVGAEVIASINIAGSDAIQIDLSNQAAGVYFLNFKLDGLTATKMIAIGTK